ncbi:ArnT family glycosyltransferase [Kitasatospora viridis]|uniref:Dolichyl-phosphate-mannose-protein mannosyltransferase n=1 Tax=Kitasatospora viridis TaxID=281105 RepID=A0A561UBU7_9ACTN|nr:glycosyltransferase family 39 protein [Kitasatospora viridis]TWF96834.1 dolichyl-phosphate-mannose-protein mannosyltransferase [Kitasatospora viridis]
MTAIDLLSVYAEPRRPVAVRLRAALADRLPLIAILLVQCALAYRLANTAFEDEALYIYAGHRELGHLLHGVPVGDTYASYFSGIPVLYPVAAAVIDSALGLGGVRAFSLLAMLGATALLWTTTRRLYGKPAAVIGAALFATCAPTLFLSRLATYDAPSVFLLALALWWTVRTAHRSPFLVLLAAPPLVLAAGVKYASALYLPTVVLAAVLTVPALGLSWWRGVLRGVLLGAGTAALLFAGLDAAGAGVRAGLSQTTVNRTTGAEPLSNILRLSLIWGGWVAALAVVGVGVLIVRRRGWAPVLLGALLTGTAALATAYQAHLGTSVSLHKHVGFGLLFAAPLAGAGLAALSGLPPLRDSVPMLRRAVPGVAVGTCAVLAYYAGNAAGPMYGWPDSSGLVAELRPLVHPGQDRYLVEEDEVPRYYLRTQADPSQWLNTYYFQYGDSTGKQLVNLPAYQAAFADGYFDLVVLDDGPTAALDKQLTQALNAPGSRYHQLAHIPAASGHGTQYYTVWQRG